MQGRTDRQEHTGTIDRRTLLRRAGVTAAGAGVAAAALPGGTARASAGADAVQHVDPAGDDAADGRTPGTAKRSWQRAIDALPATGGTLAVAAGVHETAAPIVVAGKAVAIACTPGAVLRATGRLGALLTYDRVVDAPGVGVDGLTLDLGGHTWRGLVVRDCWMTDHTIRVVGVGSGTAVHLVTERPDFGCYYNRVRVKCVGAGGTPVPGSVGVLVEGQAARNRTNHNTIVDCRLGNLDTGILIGAWTDANTVERTDCTGCGIGYDLRSGTTHLPQAWEEGNTRGFVVRDGAVARLSALYAERWEVEGSGVLHHDRGVVAGPGATAAVEHVRRAEGGAELRERWQPREGRLSWVAVDGAGVERELLALSAAAGQGYQEFRAASTAPVAPDAGGVRLFVRTGKRGGTELCAALPSGKVVVLAGDGARTPARAKKPRRRTVKRRRPQRRPAGGRRTRRQPAAGRRANRRR